MFLGFWIFLPKGNSILSKHQILIFFKGLAWPFLSQCILHILGHYVLWLIVSMKHRITLSKMQLHLTFFTSTQFTSSWSWPGSAWGLLNIRFKLTKFHPVTTHMNYSITHKLVTFLPLSLAGWEHVISNFKMTTPQHVIIPLLNTETYTPWGYQACLCSSYNCCFNYGTGILTRQTLSLWGAKLTPPERWLNRLI